jgi:hypothetical protein
VLQIALALQIMVYALRHLGLLTLGVGRVALDTYAR